ncbi:ADP-forming succinate--CoA ligase subunit beta [bacterium]|nr:MAG: ADP-forming succinate--CoA ligase subunit beta [bacterium]
MKLQEYQTKSIFEERYGIPTVEGAVASSPEEARAIAEKLRSRVAIKAQVLVGGRGKAGGIKLAENPDDAFEKASAILGMDIKGINVKKVLVVKAINIAQEAYVGVVLDRKRKCPVVIVSGEGGVEIEVVAKETPEKVHQFPINPCAGMRPYKARTIIGKLYDDQNKIKAGAKILMGLYKAFIDCDASLAEINPLVVTAEGDVLAVDSKMVLDDNGLFRHENLAALRNLDEENPAENEAREAGLSFVKLDGNIGCVVNGAGLAMATMDLVKHFGAEPANFLDIGGSSNPEKVVTALKIITRDPNVKVILFNIFGGITRCDDVANGLIKALDEFKVDVPILVRLTGTNENEAREILSRANLPMFTTMDKVVSEAAKLAS